MNAKQSVRFDPRVLRELAGEKAYARGEAYHRDGLVAILRLAPGRVVAQVSGSENYRTELTGAGEGLGGSCTCRAFEDYGFCKHMVAVGLAANGAAGEDARDSLGRIRDHLSSKGVDQLVEMILALAERDAALFRKLDLASAKLGGDDKALEKRLRKALDSATRIRDYVSYAEAAGWADGVADAVEAFADLASGPQAGLALRLAEHAIDRIESAMGAIDDSDGHLGALLERAQAIHLAACTAAKPDPVALARDLFRRETGSDFETFHGAVARYEEVLGDSGLAEYRRLAEAAWRKVPARMGKRRARDSDAADGFRLVPILDFFAERAGDVEARIALRAKDLSSPWRYLQFAQFCLDQGREDEALRRAEEGLWIFEDEGLDETLVSFVAELLAKKGRKAEAAERLRQAFEERPHLRMYQKLATIGGTPAKERAIAWLAAQCETGKDPVGLREGLVDILTHDKRFHEAWAAVRKYNVSLHAKAALAKASEAAHPREAITVYIEQVERLAGAGIYVEATKLVQRTARLQDGPEHAAYLADLKERHRRKRNFMKLLG
jgi:uncharacterized Zn finger protein